MNKTVQNILRWIAILPGSLAAGILSTFLLHFVLYMTLTKFATPYPEFPERVLTPFFVPLAFISTGSAIAPKHKLKVGAILFSIWIFLAGGLILTTLTGGNWFGKTLYLNASGVAPISGIIGAFTGLYLVWNKNKGVSPKSEIDEEVPHKNESITKVELPTNKKSFYDNYGMDIFNSIFVGLFVICLFSVTTRSVILALLLLLNIIELVSSLKMKKFTTKVMRINIAKNCFMVIALSYGLLCPTYSYYVIVLCIALQTFELLRHFIMTHLVAKNSTTAQH